MLLALMVSGCATVDRDDLSSYVQQLHSDAAEGALVAGQAAAGRAPSIFVWLESAELEHLVGELRDHLDGEMAAPDVVSQVKATKAIVGAVSHNLEALHSYANDRAASAMLVEPLSTEADRAESLFTVLQ